MPPSKLPFWKWPTGICPSKVWSHLIQQRPPIHALYPTQAERNALFRFRLRPYTYPQHFHDWDWPADPQIPLSKLSPKGSASPAADMGRSGYDTTNMKVAKNPRPAASNAPKPKGIDEKKKQPPPSQPPPKGDGKEQGASSPQFSHMLLELASLYDGVVGAVLDIANWHADRIDRGVDCPKYIFPQPDGKQPKKELPIPSLEGRGWTFWL